MKLSSWVLAARPRTLSLSVTPVIVGAALAWASGRTVAWTAVLAALLGAVLIQLATNLHNDFVDSERGDTGPQRVGPVRVAASGLLTPRSVQLGAFACFAAAALLGLYLVYVGGWPIFLLGILSIWAGWAYNGGPLPIAYTPLGEVFVVAFFGLGAVCGTYWLSTGTLDKAALATGIALGLMAAAVLMVNNYRDAEPDTLRGRHTLAIVAGPKITTWIYAGLVLLPFVLLAPIAQGLPRGQVWLAAIAVPLAFWLVYRFMHEPRGPNFNNILFRTVQLQSAFGLLLAIGFML